MTSNNLGVIYLDLDQQAQALAAGIDAVRAGEQLVRIHRSIPNYRGGLAGSHNNLARVYERYGPAASAEEHLRIACSISRDVARDHPDVIAYQHDLGKHLTNLASVIQTLGKTSESRDLCREAIATLEPIAGKDSSDPKLAVSLAQARYSLAYLQLSMTGPGEEILAESDRAIAGLEAVLRRTPGHAEARISLRRAWSCKALALFLAGSFREALPILEGPESEGWTSEALRRQLLGLSLAGVGDWPRAIAEARDSKTLKAVESRPVDLFRLACVEMRCGQAIDDDKTTAEAIRARLALECEVRASELIRRYALVDAALPLDFQDWPATLRDDVDWQIFRSILETPRFAFILAMGYSRASSESTRNREVLERQALSALRLALARGYFLQPDHLGRLHSEAALAPVRRLHGFTKLLEDLEKGPAQSPGRVGPP